MPHPSLYGLYTITDPDLIPADKLVDTVEQAISGGATLVQYRNKPAPRETRRREAASLAMLCGKHNVIFIVNDDVALAAEVGAAGVHLGRDDPDIGAARQALGRDMIIGISCYNDIERARGAAQAGADYLAFGRFFPSLTKPGAVPASVELLREAKQAFSLPLVAIGGITPENGAQLVAAGADMLAVIHGVFGQPDTVLAAQQYSKLFVY